MYSHRISLKKTKIVGKNYKKVKQEILQLLLFISIYSLSVSCSHGVEPKQKVIPEEISNGILPLKVGNYWNYKKYTLNADGSLHNEIDQYNYYISRISYDPSQKIKEAIFHRIYTFASTGATGNDEWFFRNYDDGLYSMGGKMPLDSIYIKTIYFRFPVHKGDTWKSPHLVYDISINKYAINDSITYTCTDTNAVFETPLGNFSCIVYYHQEIQDNDVSAIHDIYEYYLKGVGMVGITTISYFDSTHESLPSSRVVLVGTNLIANK